MVVVRVNYGEEDVVPKDDDCEDGNIATGRGQHFNQGAEEHTYYVTSTSAGL